MSRILVVDDDARLREAIVKVLRRGGHTVRGGDSGASAMRLLSEHPTDLVVTDIFMPEMDGVELTSRIKTSSPEVAVIVMSGGGIVEMQRALGVAEHLGADRTISKPFEIADFLAVVSAVLGDAPRAATGGLE